MTRQVAQHPVLVIDLLQIGGIIQLIAERQHPVVGVQVLVADADDLRPRPHGILQLLLDPPDGAVFHIALAVAVGVYHQDPQTRVHLVHIAEGLLVPADGLLPAEGGVQLLILIGSQTGHGLQSRAVEGAVVGASAVHIVISGNGQHLHAAILQGMQLLCQLPVALLGTVEGQVTAEDQHIGLFSCRLLQQSPGDLGRIAHRLPVAARSRLVKIIPHQVGRDVMQVGGRPDGHRLRQRPPAARQQSCRCQHQHQCNH